MDKNQYLLLFAGCIPVRGVKKSMIIDTERDELFRFDSRYYPFIHLLENKKYTEAIQAVDEDQREYMEEFTRFILENELGFFTGTPALFPKPAETWSSPRSLQNAILDFKTVKYDYIRVVKQLLQLGCHHLQFRFFSRHTLDFLIQFMKAPELNKFRSVELIVPYDDTFTEEKLRTFLSANPVISLLYIYSTKASRLKELQYGPEVITRIILLEEDTISPDNCGNINIKNMRIPDTGTFYENKFHNSCLNRKISIDTEGYIRNCPSMKEHYGHCENVLLKDVIANPAYKKYGNIRKDQIEVCKDCEYRYICNDCRAYTRNNHFYGKPLKCKYDPYTGEWTE